MSQQAIKDIRVDAQPDALRLEWALPVEESALLWAHNDMEVCLYSDPFPDLDAPQLLSSGLDGRQYTQGSTFTATFGFGGMGLESNRGGETSESAFRPGAVIDTRDGRCYPLHFNLTDFHPPHDAHAVYISVKWPVSNPDWLDKPVTLYVAFGQGEKLQMEYRVVVDANPTEHKPTAV